MRFRFFLPLLMVTLASSPRVCAADASEVTHAQLRQNIENAVKKSGLHAGVAIKELGTGEEILLNADEVFPLGSSIRIHLVTELFRQAAAKKVSLDEIRPLPESARTGGSGVLRYMDAGSVAMNLRDYATLLITVNDNCAANFLTDILGMDNVNASLAAQGTPEIKFRRRAVSRFDAPNAPENVGTPRAVMHALELLHRGEVVDRATSEAIIEVLAMPEVSYFKRELPSFIRFAGRSGSGPNYRCESGIVLVPNHPYVLCVLIRDLRLSLERPRDYSKVDALIGEITRYAQERYMPMVAGRSKKRGT